MLWLIFVGSLNTFIKYTRLTVIINIHLFIISSHSSFAYLGCFYFWVCVFFLFNFCLLMVFSLAILLWKIQARFIWIHFAATCIDHCACKRKGCSESKPNQTNSSPYLCMYACILCITSRYLEILSPTLK